MMDVPASLVYRERLTAVVQRAYPVVAGRIKNLRVDILVVPLTERLAFCYLGRILFLPPQRALELFQALDGPQNSDAVWSRLLKESSRQKREVLIVLGGIFVLGALVLMGLNQFIP